MGVVIILDDDIRIAAHSSGGLSPGVITVIVTVAALLAMLGVGYHFIRDKIAINTELYDKKASMYDTSMKNHQDRVQIDVEKQMGDFKTEMNEKFAAITAAQDAIQSDVSQIKGQVGNIETQIKVQVGNIETLLNERLPPPSPNPQDPTNHPLA